MSLTISSSPAQRSAHIISLLNASANTPYIGEPISQLEHSLQCAYLAATAKPPVDEETIIAALLHDIGQFIPEDELKAVLGAETGVQDMVATENSSSSIGPVRSKGSVGRVGHDELGARYLSALGFSEKISRLVGSHVVAKRYLCAIDPSYHGALSEASKISLKFQGGPMSGEEKEEFANSAWCNEMCKVRRWDDSAKMENLQTPRAHEYADLIEKHL
jgi:putative nucleotidyltransferase with HDIG domain